MNVAIITNLNGIGLQRDAELLREFLEPLGHRVEYFQFDGFLDDWKKTGVQMDLAIFLEVIPRNMLGLAPIKWAFLNPEWCKPDVIKIANQHMDRIFAKTREAARLFAEAFPGKSYYTGFLTRDQLDTRVHRRRHFLHVGGNSSIRGTQAVVDAWKWSKNGIRINAELHVISSRVSDQDAPSHVHFYQQADESTLKFLQNRCMFHLYPSGTEGWGHALHEAQTVGATILTLAAPPMNEILVAHQIKPVGSRKIHLADVYEVSALDIWTAVKDIGEISPNVYQFGYEQTREEFKTNQATFAKAFTEQLETLKAPAPIVRNVQRVKGAGVEVAFIGNFKADESTENMVRLALEEGLDHSVTLLQENEVNLDAIKSAMATSDMLLWVRTPGWLQVTDPRMTEFLAEQKRPTVSLHLDKFWGIPEREAQIGKLPFWKTEHVYTADGGRGYDFAERGVNHHWMRPAVSEIYCHPGRPWDMYRCDVCFVGAKEYHSEYPFRKKMVEFLEETYRERFRHIEGIRGHALNDVYASARVVVGDCIFAGVPAYWSDRVPETVGRHGLLVHPDIEGLNIPLGGTYLPQNMNSLHYAIDRALQMPNTERFDRIRCGAAHVLKYDTWTIRMKEILDEVL